MYNLIIGLYALIVRLISPFHRKARLMVNGHKEVFEKLAKEINPQDKYIWIHAASLGEFEQGRPIIERIKAEYPQYKVLLTFFSPSGYEVRKDYNLADIVCYLPFDKKKNAKRFIKAVNPALAVFIKYEFWYNYIYRLHRNNIPVYMVSAIFRPQQAFFKWYGWSFRKILSFYKCICLQDENSQNLLSKIGINNTEVCGDTRFDRVVQIKNQSQDLPILDLFVKQAKQNDIKTLVAGSSWPKDEDLFVPYFNHSNIKLVIAPHEISEPHLAYIETLLTRPAIRYSKATTENITEYDCLIMDQFGLLSSAYAYGEIGYIGGGFGVGIHNIIEAAVYGIPVIFGPNFKKFREAHQLIELGGAYTVQDNHSFRELMDEFIQHPETLNASGNYAGAYVSSNTGVVDKVMTILGKSLA